MKEEKAARQAMCPSCCPNLGGEGWEDWGCAMLLRSVWQVGPVTRMPKISEGDILGERDQKKRKVLNKWPEVFVLVSPKI